MAKLSVNVNKVATLRNSRGGADPDILAAVDVCLAAGVPGITVHPRADQRHITTDDVQCIASRLQAADASHVEFNIEGDPSEHWMALVCQVQPTQATLVPVRPGEVTSEAGWSMDDSVRKGLIPKIEMLRDRGIRVSVFVDAGPEPVQWSKDVGADRVELYTEPYAVAFARGAEHGAQALEAYREAAQLAHDLGLGVNAGHDLNLQNLSTFLQIDHIDEVSIGHALMSRALFVGLDQVVREYLDVMRASQCRDQNSGGG